MKTLLSVNITESYLVNQFAIGGLSCHRSWPSCSRSKQSAFDRRGRHLPGRNDLIRTIHSLRNAVIGSMRPAPRAGM
jgi:hypothetical protein